VIDWRKTGHGAVVSRAGLLSDATGLVAPALRSSAHARLESIVSTEFDFVWQLLRRLGLSRPDADDATQQVFMILARRLSTIESGRERAFLYGTTRRVFANTRRGLRRRREANEDAAGDTAAEDNAPDELVEQGRARALLDALLGELPEPLRRVLVLAEIEGLSAPEIAALEAIPLGTASSRLRRARDAFRELLASVQSRNPFDSGGT
jgi:RNA polymerase sigma-70 factor (ECF subfamily)